MQLVLSRASHLATDAAAFWFLIRWAGSRRRQQGRTGRARPTALGNMFIELYADCTGSPVDSVIRDAAALAYDDPPS